jgi:hypothetical protein
MNAFFLRGSILLFLGSVGFAADLLNPTVPLTVPAGAAVRLYLTRKIPKKPGAPVEAKLLESVYAFDREVIPAGAVVMGRVSRVQPVSKWQRASAILGGDFTPLRHAFVDFASVTLPDGQHLSLRTAETEGLHSIVSLPPPKRKGQKPPRPSQSGGVLGIGKQKVEEEINAQLNARTRGLAGIIRGPNKKERIEDFLLAKLPYHRQSVRRGTRFDAELKDDVSFGAEPVEYQTMVLLGAQPPADSVVHARLRTPLDSGTAQPGKMVEAVITEPLYSAEHLLILPEGTRLTGAVVFARRARWFHRGGQLRFNFQRVELAAGCRDAGANPEGLARIPYASNAGCGGECRTQRAAGRCRRQRACDRVEDAPGGAPDCGLIANKSLDNDAGHRSTTGGAAEANVTGRTLGGMSGFGLAGTLAAQSSKYVGTAFGLYGMGWSVYSNVIARGGEVEFGQNSMIEIKFGARPPADRSKSQAE